MFSLSDATKMFALLDGLPDEKQPSLDKALRNYSVRFYLPHDDQRGRVFLYDEASICALRMIYLANECGVDRWLCEAYARWLQKNSHEAIRRVEAGEDFSFHVALVREYGELSPRIFADWERDTHARVEVAAAGYLASVEMGRFTAPAAREIRGLLACTRSGE
ncbi:hypothetical protein [Bosea sp. (in: a-proteobacteria)]|uniref:hypothetical protein n=1 Tax=Bosea sp. (in: a-proteobacteria) TaxID=1871050 RepID=UPI0027360D70|nr:hypothetical protein [Bosea sp. (in: a-proteobacteria)]MDP3409031.1 hypothetical protein [Bosea sp. (in: a-proteobacteria)]